MKTNMKKSVSLLTAAAMLCTLAACTADKPAVQVLDNPDTQPEYLSFFSSESWFDSDVTKYWSDRFTEKYNKKAYINFDGAAYYAGDGLSYREVLEKRLGSSSPDDLYIINAEDVLAFEKKGYWMDLSAMDFVNHLSPAALYQSTYNGKVFSVPLSFAGFGFIWNVDLLKSHGLAIPQNLTEFFTACEKLRTAGILPYGANKGFSLTVPAMCVGFSTLYGSENQTEKIAALNSGTPVSSYLRPGFDFLQQMIQKGYLDPQQALNATPRKEDTELFLAGKCAFICGGLGDIQQLEGKTFQAEMTGLPVLPNGCVAVYGASNRLCVNPNSKHMDTVRKFIEMVGTPEALAQSAALDHAMSSAKNGKADTTCPSEQKLVTLLQQPSQIPNQDFSLHFNTWESIRDVGRELCRGASIDQACALLDQKQQKDLKAYAAN